MFLDVNTVNMRNAYPTAYGSTLGIAGGANSQSKQPDSVSAPSGNSLSPQVEESLKIGGQANPVFGALVFIGLVFLLTFAAKKFGTVEEFRNVKASPYNILIISMAAIIGMPIWKYAFTRVPVPGVSTWVASA